MTDRLDDAFAAVRRMPPDEQDVIAQAVLSLAGLGQPAELEPEHRAAVLEGMAQAEQGLFATGTAGEILARAFQRARG